MFVSRTFIRSGVLLAKGSVPSFVFCKGEKGTLDTLYIVVSKIFVRAHCNSLVRGEEAAVEDVCLPGFCPLLRSRKYVGGSLLITERSSEQIVGRHRLRLHKISHSTVLVHEYFHVTKAEARRIHMTNSCL